MSDKKNKKLGESVNAKLQLVIKSGKYTLGLKSALRQLHAGKALVVVMADNCPALVRSLIEYYVMTGKSRLYEYPANNNVLGSACGKLFPVSVMTIMDAGDADITGILSQ